jgi:membrane-bound ClpP family serine protease
MGIVFTGAELMGAVFIAAGSVGVLIEFIRPGWVVPGVAGAVLLLFGLSRTLPRHPALAIAASVPFLLASSWLLAIAWKARRNKRTL